jgi:hypothetical protein
MSQTIAAPATTEESLTDAPATARRSTLVKWTVFAVTLIVGLVYLLVRARHESFFFDEWDWILDSRKWDVTTFLTPHNDHLSLVPLVIYKTLLRGFGLGSYAPFLATTLLLHATVVVLVFFSLRRKVPDVVAFSGALTILLLGRGAQEFLWAFQLAWLLSIAGGLGALLLLERRDRVGDIGASICVAVSLASSGLGIAVVVGVGVELIWKRSDWIRLCVVVIPGVLYGLWYLGYGHQDGKLDNIPKIPAYVGNSASGAFGGLVGKNLFAGRYLVGIGATLVAISAWTQRRVTPRLAALIATPLAFWLLTAYGRAQVNEPGASRYVYPGAVWVLLVLGEAWNGRRVPNWGVALVALAVAFSLTGNIAEIGHYADGLSGIARTQRSELGALDLTPSTVPPGYQPDQTRAPQITAGRYMSAARDFGTPGDSVAQIRAASETDRIEADRVLAEGSGLVLAGAVVPASVTCTTEPTGTTRLRSGTVTITAAADHPTTVGVSVFAEAFRTIGTVAPGTTAAIILPPIRGLSWRVHVESAATTCPPS